MLSQGTTLFYDQWRCMLRAGGVLVRGGTYAFHGCRRRGLGEELAVVTERGMENSVLRTATRVAVTASYPSEERREFERISRAISREAETRVVFDETPSRTRSVTRTVARTSRAERKFLGSEDVGNEAVLH
jgi:hypothetical protein